VSTYRHHASPGHDLRHRNSGRVAAFDGGFLLIIVELFRIVTMQRYGRQKDTMRSEADHHARFSHGAGRATELEPRCQIARCSSIKFLIRSRQRPRVSSTRWIGSRIPSHFYVKDRNGRYVYLHDGCTTPNGTGDSSKTDRTAWGG